MSQQTPSLGRTGPIDRCISSAPHASASACPGLLRIVSAQDGGICRVRLPGGRLTSAQARALAAAAARHGSGVIEITNRANLQLRGIDALHGDALIESIFAAGLGPTVAAADDVRNLLLSPTAGIDAGALLDVDPLAAQIFELLQTRTELHRLSPKFALQLDGGEDLAMLAHPHDIWLSALPSGAEFAFGLAGCPPQSADDASALAALPVAHVIEFIGVALRLFLDCAQPGQTRMRHLLETQPAAEFLRRLQMRLSFPLRRDAALVDWRRKPARALAHIGIHAQRERSYVGAVPVLGRLDSAGLHALAELADKYRGELRCAPWQSVLIASVAQSDVESLASELSALGLIVDKAALLAHTIACSGASGCARSPADTKRDARTLSDAVQQRIIERSGANTIPSLPSIHLSGCTRSCAAAHCADFTLIAQTSDRYALYQRDGRRELLGRDEHFGRLLAPSVGLHAAAALIVTYFFNPDFIPETIA